MIPAENSPEEFMKKYEIAANSRSFDNVESLISDNAVFRFSDGSYAGIDNIRKAFEETWKTNEDEEYRIIGVEWLFKSGTCAACIYRFHSRGKIHGKQFQSYGRGTNILEKKENNWRIIHEHLSLEK